MHDTRVSIIIPVFNGANYMRPAIDSALAQTWPNTEIVVINDGSTDGGETDRIARSYGDRIRYISKPNGGVASALNAGIEAMTGDIFCWLSHDDRHLPEKTTRQVEHWQALGRPDAVLISDYRLIDERGAVITDVRLDHEMLTKKPIYALLRGSIHGCSVFAPKTLFERVGDFDETLPTTQDYDLWHRSHREFPFIHMPEVLIESRWHAEQGSKKIDHVVEATTFWLRVVDGISDAEMTALEGSPYRFLAAMGAFLLANLLTAAADELDKRADERLKRKLVSVVIPLYNRPDLAVSAIGSASAQTHDNIEIIIVNDGSTEDITPVVRAVAKERRAKLINQPNAGPAAARNRGWGEAIGEYVAFLDADDLFTPDKIERQLQAMEREGRAFSHTSYLRHFPGDGALMRFDSGCHNKFPEIIGGCGIATPTVMVRRSLFDEGLKFPEHIKSGEDIVLWIKIAARYGTFGVDEALTVVRASPTSTSYDPKKLIEGVNNIIETVQCTPGLEEHLGHLEKLKIFERGLREQYGI